MSKQESSPNKPGNISITERPDGRYRAKARLRLQDRTRTDPETGAYLSGKQVQVSAIVNDPADAKAAIRAAADRRIREARQADAETVKATKAEAMLSVADGARRVLGSLAGSSEVTKSSLYLYEGHVRKHLTGSVLGAKPIADVRKLDIRAYLALVAAEVGMATAKSGRAVLHRVFRWAVDAGLRDDDPSVGVKILPPRPDEVTPKRGTLNHSRALTPAERLRLAWAVARDEQAKAQDVRDLTLAGLAIGGRIGEVLALRWCDVTLNKDGKTKVRLAATVDWVKGEGLKRRPPKTASSIRTLPVPRRVAALLKRRARAAGVDLDSLTETETPIFPTLALGSVRNPITGERESDRAAEVGTGWRDRSNVTKDIRAAFDRAGFEWASYHTLRRSAVTALADVLPIRMASDYAGHTSVRTTLDSYVGRSEVADEVADIL